MSLKDFYDAVPAPAPFPQCKTCRWYSEQTTEDQAFFDMQAENNPTRLRKACNAAGLDIRRSAFQEHLTAHHSILRSFLKEQTAAAPDPEPDGFVPNCSDIGPVNDAYFAEKAESP